MPKLFKKKSRLTQKDYEFMHSLSAAILQVAPSKFRIVLYFWVVAVVLFITWANFAYIDEIARGEGEIIPSGENQIVQNLEG
ncbi:MAG: HlyD family type I secretion periplasmic adaptor subunit, partial [Campylobacterales bacterium]|nr:HlyD family type I secretion periplasmic adaptor subunit [Campylobacterales bacterium]